MITLTYEEVEEKYGEIEVEFSSYYKYTFTFRNEERNINVVAGGHHDDVYRFEVMAGKKYKIIDLPVSTIYENGEEIYRNIW